MTASLLDLPVELLCQIAESLDTLTLCALGSTCRALNRSIFAWFFSKHPVRTKETRLHVRITSPSHILRAIRCSLGSLDGPIDDLCCYLKPDDDSDLALSNMIEQLADLRAIIDRLKKIKTLSVGLNPWDRWTMCKVSSTPDTLGSNEWAQALIALVTAAINKGCHELLIDGGGIFHQLLEKSKAVGRPVSTPNQITTGPQEEPLTIKPTLTHIALQAIRLKFDASFTMPFIDWTMRMITSSSRTLVELELSFSELPPSSTWHEFAETVDLPYITKLKMWCALSTASDPVQSSNVARFLARHPSIQLLHLQGIPVPAQPSLFPKFEGPILPNLECLQAHSYYIHWILGEGNQCYNLKQVMVLVDSFRIGESVAPYDYASLDCALDTMQGPRPSESLSFHFSEVACLVDWLRSHVDLGPGVSLLSRFNGPWRTLIVKFPWFGPLERLKEEVELFLRWVALFPNVECLALRDAPWQKSDLQSLSNIALLHALVPQLKTFIPHLASRPLSIVHSLETKKLVYLGLDD